MLVSRIRNDDLVESGPAPRADHVDDYLGPSAERFFGSGYKRVSQRITGLAWIPEPDLPAGGEAEVTYPDDWSSKSHSLADAVHLSTIDALVLSLRLVETYLRSRLGLTADQVARAWLRRYTMRPGSRPHTDLRSVPLRIALGESRPGAGGWLSTEFVCVVGGIKVRCHVEHEAGRLPAQAPLSPVTAAYHAGGYRFRTHEIGGIVMRTDNRSIAATVDVRDGARTEAGGGELGSAYQPAITLVDATLVYAQVAQILMYTLDGLRRGETNTLWMRSVDMARSGPGPALSGPVSCDSQVTRSSTLDFAGGRWRVSTMKGTFADTTVTHALGHRLPEVANV
ncbi:avirulence D protein (AvrD) [Krasilnikovia cinnamomea]|uniref:Avirulence D protein (AvrD) n=1 Tax=Krasilnikovia cinnamomea TaxID=349313 RepID=A0A4Q7ZSK4_9ACTN|nr:AvrD family protein [Krasilnikovia cinnamomea]RZU53801.1 avirulence D protein (AvrD) [Krasilnikovia cinnamomea]